MLIYTLSIKYADVAELADALVLGTSTNGVEVQVLSSAPKKTSFASLQSIDKPQNFFWGFVYIFENF